MTYRRIVSWGLIAGITYTEMQDLTPGFLLDEFVMHRQFAENMLGASRGDDSWQAESM